eukprot:m.59799 g.59799  ORF g.59799 m.59799 type:complete len:589 (+) comp11336_c0_seq3:73-1839(+)
MTSRITSAASSTINNRSEDYFQNESSGDEEEEERGFSNTSFNDGDDVDDVGAKLLDENSETKKTNNSKTKTLGGRYLSSIGEVYVDAEKHNAIPDGVNGFDELSPPPNDSNSSEGSLWSRLRANSNVLGRLRQRNTNNGNGNDNGRSHTLNLEHTTSGTNTEEHNYEENTKSIDGEPKVCSIYEYKRCMMKHVYEMTNNENRSGWKRAINRRATIHRNPKYFVNSLNFIAMYWSWTALLLFFMASLVVVATILSGIFYGASCVHDLSYAHVFWVAVGQLSTGPSLIDFSDKSPEDIGATCVFIGSLASLSTLFFQAVIISLIVRKLMKCNSGLTFTKQMVLNTRDGRPCLQLRVMNLYGTVMTNVSIIGTWIRPYETSEGEKFAQMIKIHFDGAVMMKGPNTYSHYIDKHSPLIKYFQEGKFKNGSLFINIDSYDVTMDYSYHEFWSYKLPHDVLPCHRFADSVVKGLASAVADKSYRVVFDYSTFNKAVPTHIHGTCPVCKFHGIREKCDGVCMLPARFARPDLLPPKYKEFLADDEDVQAIMKEKHVDPQVNNPPEKIVQHEGDHIEETTVSELKPIAGEENVLVE